MMMTTETSVERQAKADKNYDTHKNYNSTPIGSSLALQKRMGTRDPWHINKGD